MYKNDLSALAARLGYDEEVFLHIASQAPSYYRPFHLVVIKNGRRKIRHIDSPGKKSALQILQKRINTRLLQPELNRLPKQMIGGINKKQLLEYVLPHIDQPTVVCMDLENCFPNISQSRVFNEWVALGYSSELAKMLKMLTTVGGYLPQGPPTSPMLCNFALSKMSTEIATLCDKNGLAYTQYADDICISGDDSVARAVIGEIHKIANTYGQNIKDKKTEIMDRRHQQRSVGVILNSRPKLISKYCDVIVGEIRAIEQRGVITSGERLHIAGKILYLRGYSKDAASRMQVIFGRTLQNLTELDQDYPKSGDVKQCLHYARYRYRGKRCKYL